MANYNQISDEDRKRIIKAYLKCMLPKNISTFLNIKIGAIYNIINVYKKENRFLKKNKGGIKNQKLNNIHKNQIKEWIDENCSLSLKSLKHRVFNVFEINVCENTIRNCIQKFHYSVKRITIQPERRNNEETINLREIYANQFLINISANIEKEIIFIDEVGFCFTMRSKFGRSLVGTLAILIVP